MTTRTRTLPLALALAAAALTGAGGWRKAAAQSTSDLEALWRPRQPASRTAARPATDRHTDSLARRITARPSAMDSLRPVTLDSQTGAGHAEVARLGAPPAHHQPASFAGATPADGAMVPAEVSAEHRAAQLAATVAALALRVDSLTAVIRAAQQQIAVTQQSLAQRPAAADTAARTRAPDPSQRARADAPAGTPALKHIALSPRGSVWAALGGQVRTRYESWRRFGFGGTGNRDDDFQLARAHLSADLHFGTRARVYAEIRSADITARDLPGGRRPIDGDALDVHQGYAEIVQRLSGATLSVRAGRQELAFGRDRLISAIVWANTARAFDAARVGLASGKWTVTALWAQPVLISMDQLNKRDRGTTLYGAYATRRGAGGRVLDLYWLDFAKASAAFNGSAGRERRATVGARYAGRAAGTTLEFDVEAAYQMGSVGSAAVAAYMTGGELAYTPRGRAGAPRLRLGWDLASGDRAAGGSVETFNQLFTGSHPYYGFADYVGRQNALDIFGGVAVQPRRGTTLAVTTHGFLRSSRGDAVYAVTGAVARAPGTATSRAVGTEIDVTATHVIGRHATALAGYSYIAPGQFIRQSGAASSVRFAYGSVELRF